MKPDFVIDVGNSRIKWGRCSPTSVEAVASLPQRDSPAWQDQLRKWQVTGARLWIVSGVAPKPRDFFMDWLGEQGQTVQMLDSPKQLPLTVRLERPEQVGIDRLLNAVAANVRRPPGRPAVIVDAGSAVTVDWLDDSGAFCGGAIFPGLRLMINALYNDTALLPVVQISSPCPALPGTSTPAAIEAGVFWALAGGVTALIARLAEGQQTPAVFLGGGDGPLLQSGLDFETVLWPEMTLEGIRLATLANNG